MKSAIVTGAGKGLGRQVAQGLAKRGFGVFVTDIDEASAYATAESIGERAWALQQDVRDPGSHRAVLEAARAQGPVKVWVNNAGVLSLGPAWELDDETARRHVDVNLLGVVWGCRAAVEGMRESGGHIINIASISSLIPTPGLATYAATKSAVLSYSTSLAGDLERAQLPIHVSAVCPDAIDTDMVQHVAHSPDAGILFSAKRLLTTEDVSAAVLDLVERPKLAVTIPRSAALLVHILRPFPGLGLQALKPLHWVGERRLKTLGKR